MRLPTVTSAAGGAGRLAARGRKGARRMSQTSSPARLAAVRSRIAAAAAADKRGADAVTLIAVSKTFGAEHIRPVLEAGHRVFGENRVQEAKAK